MTDYASFSYGGAGYPLQPIANGQSLLRDADPALFYMLEFYAAVLRIHLEDRFLAECGALGVDSSVINGIVGETIPIDPAPYLIESQLKFPLLAAHRKSTKFIYEGQSKLAKDEYEVTYVLPSLQAGEAERLSPILRGVVAVIDDRTEQGMDPSYAPSSPPGLPGDPLWVRAGIARAEVKSISYGGFGPVNDLFFPAVTIGLELEEISAPSTTELVGYTGVDVAIDSKDDDGTTVADVSDFQTNPAPTLTSATPNSGTKQGGTVVTLTGTGFVVGTTPIVTFGGIAATGVRVLSTTQIQCTTAAHDAFPTFAADIVIMDIEGLSATLTAGYTFTSP